MRYRNVLGILAVAIVICCLGCGEMRGIPSHGGGKRFDEEQRAVSSAIQKSIADMDLSSLRGRRVQIVIESLSQDGGGYVLSWPGFQSAGVNGSANTSESCYTNPDSFSNGSGASGYANFGGQVAYVNHSFGSSADSNYLRASLEMKARLEDVKLVTADPEVMLYILVDVIGTNASREDVIVYNRMSLRATCEATYYATDAKAGTVILPARRTGSAATYQERHYLAVGEGGVSRTLEAVPARPLSIAAATTRPATTQPIVH